MAGQRLQKRETPWCTLFLVIGALLCHTLVLLGNYKTTSTMENIGASTKGWSNVGLGFSRSFRKELDDMMNVVAAQLLDGLQHVSSVTEMFDQVLGAVGGQADAISGGTPTVPILLQNSNIWGPFGGKVSEEEAVPKEPSVSDSMEELQPMIMHTVDSLIETGVEKLGEQLDILLMKIKPALIQVGDWILKFGDKVIASVEAFSATLDKVQKIFDQVMSQLNGQGADVEVEDALFHETFGLFDVNKTGLISSEALQQVAALYSLQVLQGTKPKQLVDKYDSDGDDMLDSQELRLMVSDESIPNSMAAMLRTYARKLSEVAGNVAAARMRDELAGTVVNYFQLVCAKNKSKVEWVSDALGNGSLPIEFTASVYAQLCLQEGSPNALTDADIGSMVLETMYDLHSDHTLEAVDTMANVTFWVANGFNPFDQPRCLKRVTQWVTQGKLSKMKEDGTSSSPNIFLQNASHVHLASLLSDSGSLSEAMSSSAMEAMPLMAERLAESNMKRVLLEKQQMRASARESCFASASSQKLLKHLNGGSAASDIKNPAIDRALNAGQPAKPETLLFAQWLAANASQTADRFQDLCFISTSESSSALDSFATQIQAVVKKMQSFLKMMKKWATPKGIKRLEKTVHDFKDKVGKDIALILSDKVEVFVNRTVPSIGKAVDKAVDNVGDVIGSQIVKAVTGPLAKALEGPLGETFGKLVGDKATGDALAEQAAGTLANNLANASTDVIGDQVSELLGSSIEMALEKAKGKLEETAGQPESLAFFQQDPEETSTMGGAVAEKGSNAWTKMVSVLHSLANLMPQAVKILKFSRKEVSKASKNMDSIFSTFSQKGPPIFDSLAYFWSLLWTLYYFFIVPMTLFLLYYGFWAGGFFGGPQPIIDDDGDIEPPTTWRGRIGTCYSSCGVCFAKCHDTQIFFWSMIIFMQVIVMLVFVISITLCILAGVKAFMANGCGQVYILGDQSVCQETVGALRQFLKTFVVGDAVELLENICPDNNLLTCTYISDEMKATGLQTTVFSFLATLLSLQLIIESAILHEHARYRRMYTKMQMQEQAGRHSA